MNVLKMIDFKVIVSVLLALIAYDLVIKGLVLRTDAYEYDEFEGEYAPQLRAVS